MTIAQTRARKQRMQERAEREASRGASPTPAPAASDAPLSFTREERVKAGVRDEQMARWRADCRVFAREVCFVTPDRWQDLFFAAISGTHIDPTAKRMMALKACKGPGKSFALAVSGWWWMLTRWHVNGIAMSITEKNLRDNLWAEFARILGRSPLLQTFFVHRGERLEAKDATLAKTWWISARSFPQEADSSTQNKTIAGLHGRHPIVICDEVGDYPDGVVVAAEAILSSLVDGKPPDGRVLLAGNPTSTEGPLYRVTKKDRQRWWVYEITSDPEDPNRTPRVDPEWVNDQIRVWGRDSDFIKVNILGQFPSQQANKLLGPDQALEAVGRHPDASYEDEPLILGVDVARYGDALSVLFARQGSMSWKPRIWRSLDLMTLADQIAQEYVNRHPDAVFVDQAGVGGGLLDRIRQLGIPAIGIDFGGSAMDQRFADRRSEMWWNMAEWVKRRGTIPDDLQLRSELCSPNYEFVVQGKTTKFKLESKLDMKRRGVASPDMADALALTFAAPVVAQRRSAKFGAPVMGVSIGKLRGGTEEEWDPFSDDGGLEGLL